MALNKFMHPRNIYKVPPDFTKLAKTYEEFSNIAKTDVSGKITIDFKDANALRVLTKCLLKSDFNLDVIIPEDRLVPTLPLRLNYILWIEDLLNSIGRLDNVKGFDIGTGACAIYPLLAATKNKWKMIGTESDDQSLQKAIENVQRNNLQELIQLKKNPGNSIMDFLFEDVLEKFDFCMCNPPFYCNVQELCESRSPARLPPKNGFTGSPQELITEGGELAFCRKIIKESKKYEDNVLIFTTMVGHKFNLHELAQDLKAEGVSHTTTEFCQGRVTRWGLAWTYKNYNLAELVPGRDKPRKKAKPVIYLLPELPSVPHDMENVSKKLKSILQELKIDFKVLNRRGNHLSMDVKAKENTWSNQRRKKRLMKRLHESEAKKAKIESTHTSDGTTLADQSVKVDEALHDVNPEIMHNTDPEQSVDNTTNEVGGKPSERRHSETNSDPNTSIESDPVVHAFFKLCKKDNDFLLEMEFLDGTLGKEGLHQIVQYIKNNWK